MSSSSFPYSPLESSINAGKIILYLGPVFSGKTTKLLEKFSKYDHQPLSTVLVKFSPSPKIEDKIISHDGLNKKAISCSKLNEQISRLLQFDIIGIDEGHLFPDLVEICEELEEKGKIIYVTALNGNEKMKPFENISRLFSRAEKIKLFDAFCFLCKECAKFSKKTEEGMKPVCRKCHENYRTECIKMEKEREVFYAENMEELDEIEIELDLEWKIRQQRNKLKYGNVMNGSEELIVNLP